MRILLFMLIPLIFFAGGVFLSSLIWGKYKRRSEALRERLDKHESIEKSLQEELEDERKAHTQLQTTCHTLEEEIAHSSAERHNLQSKVEHSAMEKKHFEKVESDYAALSENLHAQRQRFEALLQEIEDLRRHSEGHRERATAAENRVQQLDQEKSNVLGLVNKLQERLNVLGHSADQLAAEVQERQVWQKRARIARLHKRRALRHGTDDSTRRLRRRPRPTIETAAPTPAPEASKPCSPDTNNGLGKAPTVTRRVMSVAERLFAGSRGSASATPAPNGTSAPADQPAPPPTKRRLRW